MLYTTCIKLFMATFWRDSCLFPLAVGSCRTTKEIDHDASQLLETC